MLLSLLQQLKTRLVRKGRLCSARSLSVYPHFHMCAQNLHFLSNLCILPLTASKQHERSRNSCTCSVAAASQSLGSPNTITAPTVNKVTDQHGIAIAVQGFDPSISRRRRSEKGSYTPQGRVGSLRTRVLCAWGIFTWALVSNSPWIPSGLPPTTLTTSLPSFITFFLYY